MYDAATLRSEFAGLVGFQSPNDPSYPALPDYLQASSSGRYINQVHPLCTLENLYNSAPEFDKYTYPDWSAKTYLKGEIVTDNDILYKASEDLAADYPEPGAVGSDNWIETNPFAEWLNSKMDTAITELISDLIRWKKLDHANRSLIDSLKLFDGLGTISDRIIKESRFVGFEITISKQEGLMIQVDKMGLQLDAIQASVPIYLYHSSSEDPLKSFNVAVDKANTFNWKSVSDVIMKYYEDTHDVDGVFYLGYYEDDLAGETQAIRRNSTWGKEPCYGCTGWNHYSWSIWSKHISISAFYVSTAYLGEDQKLFNTEKVVYDNSTNWGMNMAITVSCDMTNFFILNKGIFADALSMKLCLKLLGEIGFTTRMNFINDKTRALALAELSESDKDSFVNKYLNELKALSLDLSGMSSDCLPCESRKGIRMRAV